MPQPTETPASTRAPAHPSSDIHPCLCYDDAPAAIAWLCRAFGFTAQLVIPGPDGGIRHSELSHGNAVIMVSSPKPEQRRVAPRRSSGASHALSVHVDDPDAHFARAQAAGATILRPLKDEDFGSRGYLAEDLEGHQWYFGTYRPGGHWGAGPQSGPQTGPGA